MTAAREERCPVHGCELVPHPEYGAVCPEVECDYSPFPAPESCPECDGTGIAGEVEHVRPVCCGRPGAECCNEPIPEYEIEQVPCDACDGSGRVSKTSGGVTASSSGSVDRDVIEEAGQAAWLAVKGPRWREVDTKLRDQLEDAILAAAPLIVKAERERLRTEIESELDVTKPGTVADQHGVVVGYRVGLKFVLALLDEEDTNDK